MIFASSLLSQRKKKMTITENSGNSQSLDSHGQLQPPIPAAETAEGAYVGF